MLLLPETALQLRQQQQQQQQQVGKQNSASPKANCVKWEKESHQQLREKL